MPEPYIGEIRIYASNRLPSGWMFCEGQLLSIAENDALFTLIGTTYGGDGENTFALPDLRGRLPIHQGNGFVPGQSGGAEEVTLTVNQIPGHAHALLASTADGTSPNPEGNVLARPPAGIMPYFEDPPTTGMAAGAIAPAGGSQPHTNFQRYLCVNFIISLFGVFPSQT